MQSELNKLQAKLNKSDNTDYESEQHAYNAGWKDGANATANAVLGNEEIGIDSDFYTEISVNDDQTVTVTIESQN